MATYRTQIDAARGQDEVFEYLATFSNATNGIPASRTGEALTPGPVAIGVGLPPGRADGGSDRAVRVPGPRHRAPPPGGTPGAPRADRVDGHHHGGVGRSRFSGRVTSRSSKRRGLLRLASPVVARVFAGMAERAAAGLRARAWHDPVAPLRRRRRSARGQCRRQLQPGRLRRALPPRALAPAPGPRRPRRRRDRRLLRHRAGGRARTGARSEPPSGSSAGTRSGSRRPPGKPATSGRVRRSSRSSSTSSTLTAVASFVGRVAAGDDRLHALVHAAGALSPTYRRAPDGGELTVATSVLAPFRLTWLAQPAPAPSRGRHHRDAVLGRHVRPALRPRPPRNAPRRVPGHHGLRAGQAGPGRAVPRVGPPLGSPTVSPATRRTPAGWTPRDWPAGCPPSPSSGRCCAPRPKGPTPWSGWRREGPGVATAPDPTLEGFFHDRHRRSEHHLPWTARSADAGDGARLWEWCQARARPARRPATPATLPTQ